MSRPIDELFGELSQPGRPLGPTSWAEPAELRKRAEHKQTVRRTVVASSVAVVAAFAFVVPATIASHRSGASPAGNPVGLGAPTGVVTAAPATFATPTPGAKIDSPLLPGAAIPTGTSERYGPISLTVPEGWTATKRSVGFGDPAALAHSVCIAPAAPTRTVEDCAGLQVWYDGFLPGAGHLPYVNTARETLAAWHHTDAVATCPAEPGSSGSPVARSQGLTEDFQQVGAKVANHNAWQVTCADGSTFQPQGWLLPKTKVLFFSYLSDKDAQAILATVTYPTG